MPVFIVIYPQRLLPMIITKLTRLLLFCLLLFAPVLTHAAEVTNVQIHQDGNRAVFSYDLVGTESSDQVQLKLTVTGKKYTQDQLHLSGDIGHVATGKGKQIIWDVLRDFPRGVGGDLQWELNGSEVKKQIYTDPVTGMEFVWVPKGCFDMGSNNGDEEVHKVCVDGFYMGKYEVTQKQWRTIMGHNPSYFKGNNHPVERVSWNNVQGYIKKLNGQSDKYYRLPTEAEWEYASKGGQNYKYAGSDNLDAVAWYVVNSGNKTHPVGRKQANGYGLYDMNGNVRELCSDRAGTNRVNRGGSWGSPPQFSVRSAFHYSISPDLRNDGAGFRLVLRDSPQVVVGEQPSSGVKQQEVEKKTYTDSTTEMEFVYVKGGCYQMGDTFGDGDSDEKPVHKVCIDGFYMGKYEVTQNQWRTIMGNNPSDFKGENRPVEQVSWDDVQNYITKLNRESGQHYRLPTEAEWEYAARSRGKDEKYAGGNDVDDVAWYDGDSIHPVGQKEANGLGVYDMSGNVWEWCNDWYGVNYYNYSSRNNPQGPSTGEKRVNRGGSSFAPPKFQRSTTRSGSLPGLSWQGLGFRLILLSSVIK